MSVCYTFSLYRLDGAGNINQGLLLKNESQHVQGFHVCKRNKENNLLNDKNKFIDNALNEKNDPRGVLKKPT